MVFAFLLFWCQKPNEKSVSKIICGSLKELQLAAQRMGWTIVFFSMTELSELHRESVLGSY
jgi:hypothetical protein